MTKMLIDTHAHLDFPDFASDLEDVLRRAEQADVKRVITIGTSIESSRRAIELAENYPSVYAAIGVHPSQVDEAEDDVITPLRELARNPRVVAIGETGLDYHHLASEVLDLDDLVSFTGIVTFKNGVDVRQVAAEIPLWKFMIETDCPYLAPVPYRGKRCEPAHTRIIAESIAAARGVSLEEIAEA